MHPNVIVFDICYLPALLHQSVDEQSTFCVFCALSNNSHTVTNTLAY